MILRQPFFPPFHSTAEDNSRRTHLCRYAVRFRVCGTRRSERLAESKMGAVAVSNGESLLPAAFAMCRCPRYIPHAPSSLPRWTMTSALVGYFLVPPHPTVLSRPARGSLALWPVGLQPARLPALVPEASAARSPCTAVRVATRMNRQLPGRNFHPPGSYALVAHLHFVLGP